MAILLIGVGASPYEAAGGALSVTCNFALTTPSGSNRFVVIRAAFADSSATADFTTCTFNGVTCTLGVGIQNASGARSAGAYLWYIKDADLPVAAGNYDVVVTGNEALAKFAVYISEFTGGDLANLISGTASASAFGATASITPSPAIGNVQLGTQGYNNNAAITASIDSGTIDNNTAYSNGVTHVGLLLGNNTTGTIGWTTSADPKAETAVIVGFNEVSTAAILPSETGSFNLSGQDINLQKASSVIGAPVTLVLAGQDVSLLKGSKLALEVSSFNMAGQDALFNREYAVSVEQGGFVLDGVDSNFKRGYIGQEEPGSFLAGGQATQHIEPGKKGVNLTVNGDFSVSTDFVNSDLGTSPLWSYVTSPVDSVSDTYIDILRVQQVNYSAIFNLTDVPLDFATMDRISVSIDAIALDFINDNYDLIVAVINLGTGETYVNNTITINELVVIRAQKTFSLVLTADGLAAPMAEWNDATLILSCVPVINSAYDAATIRIFALEFYATYNVVGLPVVIADTGAFNFSGLANVLTKQVSLNAETVNLTLTGQDVVLAEQAVPIVYGGFQTSLQATNQSSLSVAYNLLGLTIGDVVIVSVTTDYTFSLIVQDVGHPGGTTIYNASDNLVGQPRHRVDVIVFDGTWPATLDYTFDIADTETWIAFATKWTGVDETNPIADSAGNYDGATINPISPALVAPLDNVMAVAIYGAREDDFDTNGTPAGYTKVVIDTSGGSTLACSGGVAYLESLSAGAVDAAVWTQLVATEAHGTHVLLRPAAGVGDPTIAAGSGAFTSIGQDNILTKQLNASIETGGYSFSGVAANLAIQNKLAIEKGSFNFTGLGNVLTKQLNAAIETGSFDFLGKDANLIYSIASTIIAELGNFSFSGLDINLISSRNIVAGMDAFSLNGIAVSFLTTKNIAIETGSYSLTGQDASFIYSVDNTLIAEKGLFDFTGLAASFLCSYNGIADSTAFSWTGFDVGLQLGQLLIIEPGSYALNGSDVGFKLTYVIVNETGEFNFTGQNVVLSTLNSVTIETGSFNFIGQVASLLQGKRVVPETGAFNYVGIDASFLINQVVLTETGNFVLDGKDIAFIWSGVQHYYMLGESGTFNYEGYPIAFKVRLLYAEYLGKDFETVKVLY